VVARTHTGSEAKGSGVMRSQGKHLQPSALDPSRASSIQGRRGRGPGGTRAVRVPPTAHNQPTRRDYLPLLLRPTEAAEMLSLSRSTVFEVLAARELPVVRIGRATRVARDELERWVSDQISWQPQDGQALLRRLQGHAEPVSR